mgnify:CR=1 FL=1
MNKVRRGEVKIYKGKEYIAIPEIEEESCKMTLYLLNPSLRNFLMNFAK